MIAPAIESTFIDLSLPCKPLPRKWIEILIDPRNAAAIRKRQQVASCVSQKRSEVILCRNGALVLSVQHIRKCP